MYSRGRIIFNQSAPARLGDDGIDKGYKIYDFFISLYSLHSPTPTNPFHGDKRLNRAMFVSGYSRQYTRSSRGRDTTIYTRSLFFFFSLYYIIYRVIFIILLSRTPEITLGDSVKNLVGFSKIIYHTYRYVLFFCFYKIFTSRVLSLSF